jgi:prophage tail gpP-like protein
MRSMDTVPANFDIQVTEKYPNTGDISIKPGDPCQVKIGGDLVITGYVDRYITTVSGRAHDVRISGRSKSEDLVDCAAFVGSKDNPTYQILGGKTLSIAHALAKPYGVTVSSLSGDGVDIPQFNINLGETAWEIIDRITRFSSLVAYDLPDGSLVLAKTATEKMSSGFVQGVNVEVGQVTYTMDERFSEYEGFMTSALAFTTESGGHMPRGEIVKDPAVPRYRKRIIISEQVSQQGPIVKARTQWECNRRIGRSQAVTITCDSWRDTAGKLWAPNNLAPIKLPALKLADATWVIGAVAFYRDEEGQHAMVTLMPQSAFEPEPTVFQPLMPLLQDMQGNNPTKPQQ